MNRSKIGKWLPGLLAVSLVLPAVPVTSAAAQAEQPTWTEQEITLLQLFDALRDVHWEKVDEETLLQGAVQGMLNSLNDPYTEYFTAEEYNQFIDAINQNYTGIGLRLGKDAQGFFAEEVFTGSPALAAGLKNGDRILAVDGRETAGHELAEVSEWMRGKEGTSVQLKIERTGQSPFLVSITRKEIHLPSLVSSQLDAQTGYIRILSFSETVGNEFDLALADLQRKGIKSLVIDVRGNGGGMMQTAAHIADRFLSSGVILETRGRDYSDKITADPESADLPLTILIDSQTASASELLAGSLQALHKAKLVGTQSFGKGVFQEGYTLHNGNVIKMTVGQYYFADGSSPQKVGLKPDLTVQTRDLQLPVALKTLHPERSTSIKFDLASGKTYVNQLEFPNQKAVWLKQKRYLPLRFTMEALGTEVTWHSEDNSVSFQYAGRSVKLLLNTGEMLLDGQPVKTEQPLLLQDDTSYLSLDAVKAVIQPAALLNTDNLIELDAK